MARAPRRTKSPTLARPPARRPLIRNTEGKGKRRVENRAIADSPRSRVPDGGATARSRDSSSDEHDDLPHGAHSEADADAFFDMLRAPGWNRRALPAETALVNTGNPVIGRRTKKLKDTGKVKVRAEVTLEFPRRIKLDKDGDYRACWSRGTIRLRATNAEVGDLVKLVDLVDVPHEWGGFFTQSEGSRSRGDPTSFRLSAINRSLLDDHVRGSSDALARLSRLMTILAKITVTAHVLNKGGQQVFPPGHKSDISHDGFSMSAACALAVVYHALTETDSGGEVSNDALKAGEAAFIRLLVCCPPEVISEMLLFGDGYFVHSVAEEALVHIPTVLTQRSDIPHRLYTETLAKIVAVSYRYNQLKAENRNSSLKAGYLTTVCESLVNRVKERVGGSLDDGILPPFIKIAAISLGAIMAGTLKFVLELLVEAAKRRENINNLIECAISLLGFVPHMPGFAITVLTKAIQAVYAHFHKSKEWLKTTIDDMITESVYWPLIHSHVLPFTKTKIEDASLRSEFKDYFELVIRSAHVQ